MVRPLASFAIQRIFTLISALVICLATTAPTRADLVIVGGNASVSPGGTGSIDFTISSTTGLDQLSSFGVELQITPLTGNSLTVAIHSPPSPDPYFCRSNYVFAGQSLGQNLAIPFWGPPSSTTTNNDTITGGDMIDPSVNPSGFVTIPATPGNFLLTSVQFQAANGASLGDAFSIAIVVAGSNLFQRCKRKLNQLQQHSRHGYRRDNFDSRALLAAIGWPCQSGRPGVLLAKPAEGTRA